MAKRRQIHPEIWTDDKFVTLSPLARLLFIGMWNFACDNGHLDDSVLQLKMRVLPADSCDVAELLDEIVGSGMVGRADGYLKVVNLSEKQALDLRYLVLCDHCEHDGHARYSQEDKTGKRRDNGVPPSSARRAPVERSRGTLRNGVGEGVGDGDGVGESAPAKPPATDKRGTRIPEDFSLTPEMKQWATEHVPDVDVQATLPEFIDYWRGVPGQKGVKLDWIGTWRNGMRKQQKWAEERGNGRPSAKSDAVDLWAALRERPA